MMNRWVLPLATFALVIAASLAITPKYVHAADDDVFLDEGDGDFDKMPIAPKAEVAKEPVKEVKPVEKAPDIQMPDPSPEVMPEPVAEKHDAPVPNDELFGADDKTPAPKSSHKASHASHKPVKHTEHKVAEHVKVGKGHFAMTTAECPMMRKPASVDDTLGQTKAPRKIWVEDVNSKWVRVHNKDGEAAYVSRKCVKF